jgi:hypothetical protein
MDETANETTLDKRSEAFRHQCEVNWLVRKIENARNKKTAADEYIALVRKHRGDDAADKLLADARKAYKSRQNCG